MRMERCRCSARGGGGEGGRDGARAGPRPGRAVPEQPVVARRAGAGCHRHGACRMRRARPARRLHLQRMAISPEAATQSADRRSACCLLAAVE